MMYVRAKEQPRWHDFRWQLSKKIVNLARWVYPKNPDAIAFYTETMTDRLLYGQSIVRVNPKDFYRANKP